MIVSITIEHGHGGPNDLFMAKMTNKTGIWGAGAQREVAIRSMLRTAATFGEFIADVPIEIIDKTLEVTIMRASRSLKAEFTRRGRYVS